MCMRLGGQRYISYLCMYSEELFSGVGTALTPRLRDSNLSVRVQAIDALTRLQDHTDKDNEVTAEYLRIADSDPSKYVLFVCLSSFTACCIRLLCAYVSVCVRICMC
jgi:hypothetical protein